MVVFTHRTGKAGSTRRGRKRGKWKISKKLGSRARKTRFGFRGRAFKIAWILQSLSIVNET